MTESSKKFEDWYSKETQTPGSSISQLEDSLLAKKLEGVLKDTAEVGNKGGSKFLEKDTYRVAALMRAKPLEDILKKNPKITLSISKLEAEREQFGPLDSESLLRGSGNLITHKTYVEVSARDRINQLVERLNGAETGSKKELAIKKQLVETVDQLYKKELSPAVYEPILENFRNRGVGDNPEVGAKPGGSPTVPTKLVLTSKQLANPQAREVGALST